VNEQVLARRHPRDEPEPLHLVVPLDCADGVRRGDRRTARAGAA
jgi:hypothetical protein